MPQLTIDLGLLGLPVADGDGWVQAVDSLGNPIPIAATNAGTLVFGSRALDFNTSGVATITLPSTDDLEPTGVRYLVFITRTDTITQPVAVGPFVFTADASLDEVAELPPADLVAAFNAVVTAAQDVLAAIGPVEPLAAQVSGYTDHGDISGAVTFAGPTGSHWFTATGPTTITLDGYSEPDVVTLICFGGAVDVTVAGMPELELADGTAWSAQLARGVWVTGGGSGTAATPDTTPPSAITDLAAAPGEDGTTASLTFTPASDAESTPRQRIRYYAQGGLAGPWPTSGPLYGLTTSPAQLTGLTPGTTYVAEIQSYSAGGSQTVIDTVTFTTPTPAGWNTWDLATFTAPDGTLVADYDTANGRSYTAAGPQIINNKAVDPAAGNAGQWGFSMTGLPGGRTRHTVDLDATNVNGSFWPEVRILVGASTGSVGFSIECAGGVTKVGYKWTYAGVAPTVTYESGYDNNWNAAIPQVGIVEMDVDPAAKTITTYFNGTKIATLDATAWDYGGGPQNIDTSTVQIFATTEWSKIDSHQIEVYT